MVCSAPSSGNTSIIGPLTRCQVKVPSAGEPFAEIVNSDFSTTWRSLPANTDVLISLLSAPPPPPHAAKSKHAISGINEIALILSTFVSYNYLIRL